MPWHGFRAYCVPYTFPGDFDLPIRRTGTFIPGCIKVPNGSSPRIKAERRRHKVAFTAIAIYPIIIYKRLVRPTNSVRDCNGTGAAYCL